jgi:branched-chain amino acid transport system ATP-binding protein
MTEKSALLGPTSEAARPGNEVQALLSVEGLHAGYSTSTVLHDISFTVKPGQVLALLGPNGAGKTTTLRAASGVLQPQAGHVRLNGVDITSRPAHRRARAGMCLIPEGRGIFPSLTVRENLRVQVAGRRRGQDPAERALEVFPALAKHLDQAAGQLSGGQQQMVALARAYITGPKIILLDEASMGLAPVVVDLIFDALARLAETGVSMILVEQYVTRAIQMADQVVLLRKGTVAFDGPPADLDEQSILQGYLGADLPDVG